MNRRLPSASLITCAVIALGACASAPRATDPTPCAPDAPRGTRAFAATRAAELAGTHSLILVQSSPLGPGAAEGGTLHLWVPESLPRFNIPEPFWVTERTTSSGRFKVAQVRMHADSIVRWHPHPERALFGATTISLAAFGARGNVPLDSTDPTRPGVVFENGLLHIGEHPRYFGVVSYDGQGSVDLRVTWVSHDRFGGTWRTRTGHLFVDSTGRSLAPPHGFFCAVRAVTGAPMP